MILLNSIICFYLLIWNEFRCEKGGIPMADLDSKNIKQVKSKEDVQKARAAKERIEKAQLDMRPQELQNMQMKILHIKV